MLKMAKRAELKRHIEQMETANMAMDKSTRLDDHDFKEIIELGCPKRSAPALDEEIIELGCPKRSAPALEEEIIELGCPKRSAPALEEEIIELGCPKRSAPALEEEIIELGSIRPPTLDDC